METNTESTFIRRKFTIPEELDAELERMAHNNYQGNVSLCLRQAISDHRESLNGNSDPMIRHLMESVAKIEEQCKDLTESVERATEQASSQSTDLSETTDIGIEVDSHPAGVDKIISVLKETDTALRVADIIERVQLKPTAVRRLLGYLVDQGCVFTTSGDPPRYHLAKTQLSPTDQNESREGDQ